MVTFNLSDLSFNLTQIKIAESHSAGTPLTELVTNPLLPFGLRTVDGSFNNLLPGNELFGTADTLCPPQRAVEPAHSRIDRRTSRRRTARIGRTSDDAQPAECSYSQELSRNPG